MKKKICIVNYGCGNTKSIENALKFLGFNAFISNQVKDIKKSTHLILPGVGSFSNAMAKIKLNLNLKIIEKEVLEKNKPILGICVGMQIMSSYGFEFKKTKGLNWIDGSVVKMKNKPNIVPEVGWNNLIIHLKKNKLFEKIDERDYFYFVHSFNFKTLKKKEILASTNYNDKFTSIINKKNIVGVQFHPEKSQSSGLRLLKNFVENFK
jgi:imidazole glycerol-phosphate synthase subunit HisH